MAWRVAVRGEVEVGIGRWGVVLVLGFEYLVTLPGGQKQIVFYKLVIQTSFTN